MKRLFSFFILMLLVSTVLAQTTLTFTGRDANNHFIQLHRVVIANVTQGWQETIYYPDTTLIMGQVGIEDYELDNGFTLQQNNPNPFECTTYATLRTVEQGDVAMVLTDVNGRIVETKNFASPLPGIHQFRIQVASTGTFMLAARQNGKTTSIKMINKGVGATNKIEQLEFVGKENAATMTSGAKGATDKPFNMGDDMYYTGYAMANGTEYQSQVIHQNQFASQNFVLDFDINAPSGLATVTTATPTDVQGYSATCGGDVINDGGYSVIARGVCWSTTPNPVFNDSHVSCGDGLGQFSGQLTGLTPGTTYHVRAYAINSVGTAYGNQVSFTTVTYPTVTTGNVSNVAWRTATCGGNVTDDGGAAVTARGVCWSTSQNPTVSDSHTINGSDTGSFISSITNLTPGTTYYVRAYATNSVGTVYGNQVSFTTLVSVLPTVTTGNVSNVAWRTATCGGNVTDDGGAAVTARGVCWSTSQNPTVSDSHTINGSDTGSFISSITNLTPGTTYYVRAYATNSEGTAYGSQKSFTTTAAGYDGQPCPGAATVTDYDGNTYNTVQIGQQCWMKQNLKTTHYSDGTSIPLGSSTSTTTAYRYNPDDNSSNVATYGYLYNWPAVMRNSSSSSLNPSGVQGICPTGWHVPSDAEWTQLTNYVSSQSQYVCGNNTYIAKALASTTGWDSSTNTCAVGNTPSNNNATGFSAVPAGRYGGSCNNFGYGAYFWSATQTNSGNACYRYLYSNGAYVPSNSTNSKDLGYSVRCLRDESGASATLPTVTTTSVANITQNSATSGGTIPADGGAAVTARGVCWSTSQNPTTADSHTTDGSGTGNFTSSITGLQMGTTYYVRAYATNSVGTAYGNQVSFTTEVNYDGQPCPGAATVTDYDGNTYNTVQIGQQCWMKQNLKTTHYSDGDTISLGSSPSSTTAYRYNPDDNSSNVATYGYLYNWKAVMRNTSSSSSNPSGVQGICPTGWHVPSDAEWMQLTNYVSSQSQYVCGSNNTDIAKALASTTGWDSSTNTCAVGNTPTNNNAAGFSAVPAGYYNGSYLYFGGGAYFWSATQGNSSNAYTRYLDYNNAGVPSYNYNKTSGYSVRCLRD